jgi:hypothetical protein
MTAVRGQVRQQRLGFLKTAIMGNHGTMRDLLDSKGCVVAFENFNRCGQLSLKVEQTYGQVANGCVTTGVHDLL